MLPLTLTLTNFMPYRGAQEPLILEGLGVACLSGPNGAGKSSLLDAITWALWGRSRAGASAGLLVAAGAADMSVQLEFSSHTLTYRVERRHRRQGKSGNTTLDFQMRDGERWRPLNGQTVSETNRKIIETIRLDYETFINSAFLVQGKADLFVSQTSAERKRILGEILGLSVYDNYAERARGMARDFGNQQAIATGRIGHIEPELEQEESVRTERNTAAERIGTLGVERQTARDVLDRLGMQLTTMQARKRDMEEIERRAAEVTAAMAGLTAEHGTLQESIAGAESVMARRADIEAGRQELKETRVLLTGLSERSRQHASLTEQASKLELAAKEEQARLSHAHAAAERSYNDIKVQVDQLPALQTQLNMARGKQAALSEGESALQLRRADRDEMNGQLGEMRATLGTLTAERDALDPRIAALDTGSDAECPVCGTQLGQHGIERMRDHFQQRMRELDAQVEDITTRGKTMRATRDTLHAEIQQEESKLNAASAHASSDIGSLETRIVQAQAAADALPAAESGLAEATSALQALPRESDDLRAVREKMAELGYDAVAHEEAQTRETALRHWDDAQRELDAVLIRVDGEHSRLADIDRQLQERAAALKTEQARILEISVEIEGLDGLAQQAADARGTLDGLDAAIHETQSEQARLDERLEHLAKRREERDELRKAERDAARGASLHSDLAHAFGPRGVQALLIETARPEIEDDANELLGRMSNGAMTLRLETQRQTQAGGAVETLDVIISDLQGTRPYEMYSGGEAFRINFALRIALSKLLARRAGAEVPVLFIDEGFGSQDAEGRERLIEAISILRGDPLFQDGLILVITHIDDVRSRFETRIDVTKGEDGSTYTISY